jgi:choline dehydrogenase
MESVLPKEGLVELLLSLNAPGQVTVQAALQTPFRFVFSIYLFF